MHIRLSPGLLGFTAFLFHFASVVISNVPFAGPELLSLVIGAGTFFVYVKGMDITHFSNRHQPKSRIGTLFLAPVFVIASIAPLFASTFILQSLSQLTLAALLTIAYYRPFTLGNRIIIGLRAIPLAKNTVLAMAWTLATTPLSSGTAETPTLFLFRFLFILSMSIAIDNRDCGSDSENGVRTLALILGNRTSTFGSFILLIIAAGISHTRLFPEGAPVWARSLITAHTIATAVGVLILNSDSQPMTFFWLIDFQLFLHALMFLITLTCV